MFYKKISALLLAMAIIFSGCSTDKEREIPPENSTPPETQSSQEETPPKPLSTTASLLAVGDNLIHNNIYLQAQKRAGGVGYDFSYAYEGIEHLIDKYDISVINQETPLASKVAPLSNYPLFNSPIEVGEHMINLGFDVVNHANNHIYDKGEKGVKATMDFWAEHPKTIVTGVYLDGAEKREIKTLIKNDITFSFLGFTEHTNGLTVPVDSNVSVILTSETEQIKFQIEEAKKISDVVVVSIHWGNENTHKITPMQQSLATDMVNWGADIIIGTHPHVLQPINYITRDNGTKGVVIYSLGNFISSQIVAPNLIGGISTLNVTKNYEDNSISISDVKLIPIITHYDINRSNLRIYTLENYTDDLANLHDIKNKYPSFSVEYIKNIVTNVIDEKFL